MTTIVLREDQELFLQATFAAGVSSSGDSEDKDRTIALLQHQLDEVLQAAANKVSLFVDGISRFAYSCA